MMESDVPLSYFWASQIQGLWLKERRLMKLDPKRR